MIAATRSSWRTAPLPSEREHFALPVAFSPAQGERMRLGWIPEDMDDRWFMFFEEEWLYFCRSWTGHCIFAIRLDTVPSGVRVVDAWVSRDRAQYRWTDLETDMRMLERVIEGQLLLQATNEARREPRFTIYRAKSHE